MENTYIVRPRGGLNNYLRVMLSYYEYTKSTNKQLIIVWRKTHMCNGAFLDYFEPIDNIIFAKHKQYEYNNNYIGNKPHKDYEANYNLLKLKPFMQSIIDEKLNVLNNDYVAVHVRRTDLVGHVKRKNLYVDDSEYFKFLDKSDKKIYIATDNKDTYDIYYEKYGNRIAFSYHNTRNELRKTSLQDAIIDQYMCIYAKDFMGTPYSSFTGNIIKMRNK